MEGREPVCRNRVLGRRGVVVVEDRDVVCLEDVLFHVRRRFPWPADRRSWVLGRELDSGGGSLRSGLYHMV